MFEHYYRELLSFLSRKVRDRDMAADLTQESFARVYAAERSGSDIQNPRALLYQTARNLLVDSYRRAETRSTGADPTADGGIVEPDMYIGPNALEPEVALASRQRFEAIARVVDRLPTRCREAFLLVKFDGLSHAQAAQHMGVAVKTVEMQIQIALQACRECIDTMDGAPSPPRASRGRPRKEKLD
ncbi:RNA polymerase sigma factor [Comamonas sp.]|uniref:RNA polymerase sigma factor n=1 Tax=Comamonas sp. TaxID=34028 RepID=UPI002588BE9B|nr:sigma-70 family RNA polymerase sigma factor [Comamonas sp.]